VFITSDKLAQIGTYDTIHIAGESFPNSIVKLNKHLVISLCKSNDFMEFVRLGIIAVSNNEESERINLEWNKQQEVDKKERIEREESDGTMIGPAQILAYSLKLIKKFDLSDEYDEEVHKLEKVKLSIASDAEKARIASILLDNHVIEHMPPVPER
jgi:hypothetical protein